MSTCISKHGEFSEHEPGDWCPRCWAFNEEAIVAERDALRAKLAAATTVRTVGDLTARHIGKRVRVEGLHVVTEGTLRLLPYMDSFDMWWLKVGASIHVPELDTPCEVLP